MRIAYGARLVVVMACLCIPTNGYPMVAAAGLAQQDSTVALRSGPVVITAATTRRFLDSLRRAPATGLHGLALLRRHPGNADVTLLAARGVNLFARLRNNAYRVRLSPRFAETDSAARALIVGFSGLKPQDRVAPDIWNNDYTRYALVVPPRAVQNYLLDPDSALRLTVSFYPDIADTTVRRILDATARSVRKITWTDWFAVVPRTRLLQLAGSDEISWIGGPPSPIVVDNDQTRGATGVDVVQAFDVGTGKAQGLSGQGVQVGVFDTGIDQDHDDFKTVASDGTVTNRVVWSDPATTWHGTLVGGIIAGNGTRSAGVDSWGHANGGTNYQWRGMAPSAELLEVTLAKIADLDPSGAYTFNGSLASSVISSAIIDHKMDISNHSYHLLPTDQYGAFSAQRDWMIRGDAVWNGIPIPPRLQVFSAGNNGGWPDAAANAANNGYFSLNKDTKNGILVGSWNVAWGSIPGSSSLGPTSDGRIKPDVVAPGSHVTSTGYWNPTTDKALLCTSLPSGTAGAAVERRQFYGEECGTSLASPVVTGIAALILQQYATAYGVDLDVKPPLPSTLRALIIHSAHDIKNTDWFASTDTSPGPVDGPVRTYEGPDFVTGFGLVNAADAVDLTAASLIRQGSIAATCDSTTFNFWVLKEAGTVPPVKVTLAWDDPAANPDEDPRLPRLVNDLDLVLIDPGGVRHYPWRRNQTVTDNAGSVLTSAQQVCTTSIKVQTLLKSPGPLVAADIENASKGVGPDHLNNVEQVVAPGIEGQWTAIVKGFKIEVEPQQFSIVGVPWKINLVVHWTNICKTMPTLCQLRLLRVCVAHPEMCRRPQIIPLLPIGPQITFRNKNDQAVVPINQLCSFQGVPGRCEADEAGTRYTISVGRTTVPLNVELYSGEGRLVGSLKTNRPGRITLRPVRGEEYLLIVTPTAAVRAARPYELPISVRPITR